MSLQYSMNSASRRNDLNALRTLTQDRESNADVVASMIMPCLLIVGELDPRLVPVRQCASELPNAAFLGLPECDHAAFAVSGRTCDPTFESFPFEGSRLTQDLSRSSSSVLPQRDVRN
jgi:hypothetical protein